MQDAEVRILYRHGHPYSGQYRHPTQHRYGRSLPILRETPCRRDLRVYKILNTTYYSSIDLSSSGKPSFMCAAQAIQYIQRCTLFIRLCRRHIHSHLHHRADPTRLTFSTLFHRRPKAAYGGCSPHGSGCSWLFVAVRGSFLATPWLSCPIVAEKPSILPSMTPLTVFTGPFTSRDAALPLADILPPAAGMTILSSPFVGTVRHHAPGCAIHARNGHARSITQRLGGRSVSPSSLGGIHRGLTPARAGFLQVHKLTESPIYGRSFYFGILATLSFCLIRALPDSCRASSLDTVFYTFYSICLGYYLKCAALYIFIWNPWQGCRGTEGSASHCAREHAAARLARTATTFTDCKTATCFFRTIY